MKLASIFFVLALFSQTTFAATYTYECGKAYNVTRKVVISTNSTSAEYEYQATFTTAGSDATTGIVKAVDYKMVGSLENLGGTPTFAFIEKGYPSHQLVVVQTTKVGEEVEAGQINVAKKVEKEFACVLKSLQSTY